MSWLGMINDDYVNTGDGLWRPGSPALQVSPLAAAILVRTAIRYPELVASFSWLENHP